MKKYHSTYVTEDLDHIPKPDPLRFHQVTDCLWVNTFFSNNYVLSSQDGLVVIDPGMLGGSESLYRQVRHHFKDPIHTVIYTHGHVDHCFGLQAFKAHGEEFGKIIAQENCLARFDRYDKTKGLNSKINGRQFGMDDYIFPTDFIWPTQTYRDQLSIKLSDMTLELQAKKGETDDHTIIFIPEKKYLFTGDLVIWRMPNCGNPQKVQRYPVEWAQALREMAELDAEFLFPGHGPMIYGKEQIRQLLLETAEYLQYIIDQVLELLNQGLDHESIYHQVKTHPTLSSRLFLQPTYDNPKYIFRNLLRLYSGWWNGNPAMLDPPESSAKGKALVVHMGIDQTISLIHNCLKQKDYKTAAHYVIDVTNALPQNLDLQVLKRDIFEVLMDQATDLMTKSIYRDTVNQARIALNQDPIRVDLMKNF